MIFVSAGTQFPFDRLIEMVDTLAGETDEEVVAQAIPDKYEPKNFRLLGIIPQGEYTDLVNKCDLVVAHAGMGAIITAMRIGKPILVLPRLASKGEHRNDHQTSTARHLQQMGYVTTISNLDELRRHSRDRHSITRHRLDDEVQPEITDYIMDQVNKAKAGKHKHDR